MWGRVFLAVVLEGIELFVNATIFDRYGMRMISWTVLLCQPMLLG